MDEDMVGLKIHLEKLSKSAKTAELREWAATALEDLAYVSGGVDWDYPLPLNSDLWYSSGMGNLLSVQVPAGTKELTEETYWQLLAQRLQWMLEREGSDLDLAHEVLDGLTEAGVGNDLDPETFLNSPQRRGQLLVDSWSLRQRLQDKGMWHGIPEWPVQVDPEESGEDDLLETTMEELLGTLIY